MDMPKPGDAHKKLHGLIGQWSGPETMHPSPWDPQGGPATATVTNRAILDGFAVVQEYEQRRKGAPNFTGHGVFWYDAGKDEYVMTWWDSMSGVGNEYRGQFDGQVLTVGAPMPGGAGHSRASFDISKPGAYAFALEISQDGTTWQPSMSGTYRKGGAAKAKKSARKAAKKAAPAKRASKGGAARTSAKSAKNAKSAKKAARKAKRR